MWFQNGCSKVVIELCVSLYWPKIIPRLPCGFKSNLHCMLVWFWNDPYNFRPLSSLNKRVWSKHSSSGSLNPRLFLFSTHFEHAWCSRPVRRNCCAKFCFQLLIVVCFSKNRKINSQLLLARGVLGYLELYFT